MGPLSQVLHTLPWKDINISVIQVEASHLQVLSHQRNNETRPTSNAKMDTNRIQKNITLRERRSTKIKTKQNISKNKSTNSPRKLGHCNGYVPHLFKDKINMNEYQKRLTSFLETKGYQLLTNIGEDYIFIYKDFKVSI